jgi:hypothetical protein
MPLGLISFVIAKDYDFGPRLIDTKAKRSEKKSYSLFISFCKPDLTLENITTSSAWKRMATTVLNKHGESSRT